MKRVEIKCLFLIFIIMMFNFSETMKIVRSRYKMKMKLKRVGTILKEMSSLKKFSSFFIAFVKTAFTKLIGQPDDTFDEVTEIVESAIGGGCQKKAYEFYQKYIKEEMKNNGKRVEILDEVYGNDNMGIQLRQETRERCESLQNALKDGTIKKESFFEQIGNGILSLISIIPMPSFMKKIKIKIEDTTKSYLEKNVEYIDTTLSKENLKYLQSIKNKHTFKKDASEFIEDSISALDALIFGKKNICEIWSGFSDVSTSLFIKAFVMAGFEGLKCGGNVIISIKEIDDLITELKHKKPDLEKFTKYKELVNNNDQSIVSTKTFCSLIKILSDFTDLNEIADMFCSEGFSFFSIVSLRKSLKSLKDKTQFHFDSIKYKTGEVLNSSSNSISKFFFKSDFCDFIKILKGMGIKEVEDIVVNVDSYICEFGSFEKLTNFISKALEKGKNFEFKQESFCKLIKQVSEIGLSSYYQPYVSALTDFYCSSGIKVITTVKKILSEIKTKNEEAEKEYSKLSSEAKEKLKTSFGIKEFCSILEIFRNLNLTPDLGALMHVLEGVLCDKSHFFESVIKKRDEILQLIKNTFSQVKERSQKQVDSVSSNLILDKNIISTFYLGISNIVNIDESSIFIQILRKWLKLPAPAIDSLFNSFFNLIGNFFQPLNESINSAITENPNAPELLNKLKSLKDDLNWISELKINYKDIPANLTVSNLQSLISFIQRLFDIAINPKEAQKDVQQTLSKIVFNAFIQMKVLDKNIKNVLDSLRTMETVKKSLQEDLKKDIMHKYDSQINAIKDLSYEKKQKLKENMDIEFQNELKQKLKDFVNPKKLIENLKNKLKDTLSLEINNLLNGNIKIISNTVNSAVATIKNQLNETLISKLKQKFLELGKNEIEKVRESVINQTIEDFSLKIKENSEIEKSSDDEKNKLKEDFKKELADKLNELVKQYSESSKVAEEMRTKLKAELEKEMSDKFNKSIKDIDHLATQDKNIKEDLISEEIKSLKEEIIKQTHSVLTEKVKAMKPEDLLDKIKNHFEEIKSLTEILSVGEKLVDLSSKVTKLYTNNDLNSLIKGDGIKIKSKRDLDAFLKKKKESVWQDLIKEKDHLLKKIEEEKHKSSQLPHQHEFLKNLETQREKGMEALLKNYEEKMKILNNFKTNISKKNFCKFFQSNNSFGIPSENIFNIIILETFCDSDIFAKIMRLKEEVFNIKESAMKNKNSDNLMLVPKKEILRLLDYYVDVPENSSFTSLAFGIIKELFGGQSFSQKFIDNFSILEKAVTGKSNGEAIFRINDICSFIKPIEGSLFSVISFILCGVEIPKEWQDKIELLKKIINMNQQHIKIIPPTQEIKGLFSKQEICDFYKVMVPPPEKGFNFQYILHFLLEKFLCGKEKDLNEIKNNIKSATQEAVKNVKSGLEDEIKKVVQDEKLEKAYSEMGITNKAEVCKLIKDLKKMNLFEEEYKLIEKMLATVFCGEKFKVNDFGKSIDLPNMIKNIIINIMEDVAKGVMVAVFPPALIYFAIKFIFANFTYIHNISKYIIKGDKKNEAEVKQLFNDLGSMIAQKIIP